MSTISCNRLSLIAKLQLEVPSQLNNPMLMSHQVNKSLSSKCLKLNRRSSKHRSASFVWLPRRTQPWPHAVISACVGIAVRCSSRWLTIRSALFVETGSETTSKFMNETLTSKKYPSSNNSNQMKISNEFTLKIPGSDFISVISTN